MSSPHLANVYSQYQAGLKVLRFLSALLAEKQKKNNIDVKNRYQVPVPFYSRLEIG
jgi:hypothetical protein